MTTKIISPKLELGATAKVVTLAAGCFWGVEKIMQKQLKGKGLIDARVGYANGLSSAGNVTYEKVCTGSTNFAESLQVSYDSSKLSLREVLDVFFRIHDPTTLNRQGMDSGTQYRSGIFTHSEEDLHVAEEVKKYFQKEWYPNDKVSTVIEPIKIWYDAEEYHQEYLDKNPHGYECPLHFYRLKPKV